ncbi:MAG: ATP-binding cassette domain-containing protein, partial [Armatimonadetes bacterium]|nr:ATP-binding cassette domain-containing protein [Armatimonadota bacterium]
MSGIVKRFGETTALDGVEFELRPGEIHALLGENGAGKSTLMHVLGGLYVPEGGTIAVHGRPQRFRSARDAVRAGIGMVHQHFTLVENFTVAENLALALPQQTPFLLPRRALARAALELGRRLGWELEADTPVWQLPVGVQQRLEIVKVLAQEPRILILDEPTAVLAPVELEELFQVLRRLRDEGRSLVFISHKLNEVMDLCDRVTVLRRGRRTGTVAVGETSARHLARWMMGEAEAGDGTVDRAEAESDPRAVRTTASGSSAETVLSLRELRVRDERNLEAVRGVSLEVAAGEILGLAGVDGNGQAELAEAILGLRPSAGGELRFRPTPGAAESGAIPRGRVGYVPQDRRRDGLVLGMTV